jgi:hypothetical protein
MMKKIVLYRYHKNINDWYKLIGEFFEETEGFTKAYTKKCTLDGIQVAISWDDYSWEVEEIK